MYLFCGVWIFSVWAVKYSPEHPVVAVGLADIGAASWILTRPTLRNYQFAVLGIFVVMISAHLVYLFSLIFTENQPSLIVLVWTLTALFYTQIFITVWAKWYDERQRVVTRRHGMVDFVGSWSLRGHSWYPLPNEKKDA